MRAALATNRAVTVEGGLRGPALEMQKGRSVAAAALLLSIMVAGLEPAFGLTPGSPGLTLGLTLPLGRRRFRRRRRHRPACLGDRLGSRSRHRR